MAPRARKIPLHFVRRDFKDGLCKSPLKPPVSEANG